VLTAKPRRQQVVADNRDLSDQDVFKCAIPGVKLQQRTRSAIIPEKRVPKSPHIGAFAVANRPGRGIITAKRLTPVR